MREVDAAWLAGLLEGEGCFNLKVDKRPGRRARLSVALEMTDRDVVARAASFMGCNLTGPYTRIDKPEHQESYRCEATGALAEDLMLLVYPYMGLRRSSKIDELLRQTNLSHHERQAA